jgi:CHAT domain-containing protein
MCQVSLLGLCLAGCGSTTGMRRSSEEPGQAVQQARDTSRQWKRVAALFDGTYRYEWSIAALQEALDVERRSLGDSDTLTVATRISLAHRYMRFARQIALTGATARAERWLRDARDLCREDVPCRAQAEHDLGVLYLVREDRRAEPMFRSSHESASVSEEFLTKIIWLRVALGQPTDSRSIMHAAWAAHHQIAATDPQTNAALADIAASLEDTLAAYAGPLASLHGSLLSAHAGARGHPSIEQADSLHALADAQAARGSFDQAQALLEHALAIRRLLGDMHPVVTSTLNAMSLLLVARGDIESALVMRDRTRMVMHTALETMIASAAEDEIIEHIAALRADTDGLISIHLGVAPDNPAAARLVFDSILRDKSRALDVIAARTALLRMHSREQIRRFFGDWQPDLFYWEAQRRQRQERATEALAELGRVRAALAASVYRGRDAREIRRLETHVGKLEREVIQLAGTHDVATYISTTMVQRQLPANAALVEIVQYRPFDFQAWTWRAARYAAYVLRADGRPFGVDLGAVSDIDSRVHELREAIATQRPIEKIAALARLADTEIMERVRPMLGDAREIFVSPDGTLHLLPFAALVDEQGRYLVERFTFTYLNSGRDLVLHGRRATHPHGAIIVAAPDFEAGPAPGEQAIAFAGHDRPHSSDLDVFAPLPGTAQEAAMLRALLPRAEIWTGASATEAAIARVQNPQILHIATHGVFLGAPEAGESLTRPAGESSTPETSWQPDRHRHPLLLAGLALAGANRALRSGHPRERDDGLLTALEITSLDLSGTELVTLSACDTGIGIATGDRGIAGLRRALAVAGSRTQVLSLWQVSDAGTIELMKRYYQKLIAGAGRSAAMREVQRELLRQPRNAHPFYWASFVVSGQPGPLSGLEPRAGRRQPRATRAALAPGLAADRRAGAVVWALPAEPAQERIRGHILRSVIRVVRKNPSFTNLDGATLTHARFALGLNDTTLTVSQACRFGEMVDVEHIILIDGYELGARSAEKTPVDRSSLWVEKERSFTESSVWLSVRLRVVDVATCGISPEIPVSGHGRDVAHGNHPLYGALLRAQQRFERHLQGKLLEVAHE